MRKLTCLITNAQPTQHVRNEMAFLFRRLEGKQAEITIAEYVEKASDAQRAYYFAVIVSAFIRWYEGKGSYESDTEMHASMMRVVGGFGKPYICPISGEPQWERWSWNDLSKKAAEAYMEACRAYMAKESKGEVQIPLPNEIPLDAY